RFHPAAELVLESHQPAQSASFGCDDGDLLPLDWLRRAVVAECPTGYKRADASRGRHTCQAVWPGDPAPLRQERGGNLRLWRDCDAAAAWWISRGHIPDAGRLLLRRAGSSVQN